MYHIEYKNLIVFGEGQRSFGVNRNQILETLLAWYIKNKVSYLVYWVCRYTTLSKRNLLFLWEVKGHLGSPVVILWKHCKHYISRPNLWKPCSCKHDIPKGEAKVTYLVCTVGIAHWVEIKGLLGSNCENVVNTMGGFRGGGPGAPGPPPFQKMLIFFF